LKSPGSPPVVGAPLGQQSQLRIVVGITGVYGAANVGRTDHRTASDTFALWRWVLQRRGHVGISGAVVRLTSFSRVARLVAPRRLHGCAHRTISDSSLWLNADRCDGLDDRIILWDSSHSRVPTLSRGFVCRTH